ncbi:unnamed protein product [Didymodactylos carnosus]|uniref:GH18 domain-containing protein n=1 Tax=Didymodactylos carnosus TaxID=1234261 RepID=A0A813QBP0_9BILA|nr:unnamed protein product [Didymodactylos carnosus]CAF3546035.1 unnamed protein product [Didymodactylos carnosus]
MLKSLNSWVLFRCPSRSTFNEQMQQCVNKWAVSDIFPLDTDPQFRRVANFIMATPAPNSYNEEMHPRQFSLPSSVTKLMESISIQKREQSYDNQKSSLKIDSSNRIDEISSKKEGSGVLWSNSYPIMRLSDTPVLERKKYTDGKSNGRNTFKSLPVNENELKYKKVCYYTNWSQYRPGLGKFSPENIDPFLCTHIVYAFAYINNKTLLLTKVEENDEDLYRRVNKLKTRNPNLKTLLGVGGWNMKSDAFSAVVRIRYISILSYIRKHDFDGLETDWEFPGIRGGNSDDKYYFTAFLRVSKYSKEAIFLILNDNNVFKEFKEAALAQSLVTGKSRLLLAAAVAAGREIVANAYEIEKISK